MNYAQRIQDAVDNFYLDHKYISDEAVDEIIDRYWEDIDPEEEAIFIDHPSLNGQIIIEFNPEYDEEYDEDEENYPYLITRIYDDEDDIDRDQLQIERGLEFEAYQLNLINHVIYSRSNGSSTVAC